MSYVASRFFRFHRLHSFHFTLDTDHPKVFCFFRFVIIIYSSPAFTYFQGMYL